LGKEKYEKRQGKWKKEKERYQRDKKKELT
jgi:hypothetical protein